MLFLEIRGQGTLNSIDNKVLIRKYYTKVGMGVYNVWKKFFSVLREKAPLNSVSLTINLYIIL